ncbi:MAG: hypothetical protein WCO65_02845 [bacterium]
MNFWSLFSKKENKNELKKSVLLIDIGSASVTCALAIFENNKPTIIASESSRIAILSNLTYLQFEKEMQRALIVCLGKIVKQSRTSIDYINVCLASPWYDSQVRTAKLMRNQTFVVSKNILDDMVRRELNAFEEEQIKAKKVATDVVRVIESQTIRARLNGYETHEPVGLSVKELEITMFLSIASEKTLASIETIISRVYAGTIHFSTFLSTTYLVAREFFPHQESYMIMDIGGEITDVSFVKQNALQQSFSFPSGKNFILRRLSTGLQRTIPESQTLWALHNEAKTSGPVYEACNKILIEAKKEWQVAFQQALYTASRDLAVPDSILLSVDDDISFWFSDAIKNEQFHQNTLAGKEFKVFFMNSSLFNTNISFTLGVEKKAAVMMECIGIKYLIDNAMLKI